MKAHTISSSNSSLMDGNHSAQQQQVVHLVSVAEAEKILYKFKDIPASSCKKKHSRRSHIHTIIKGPQNSAKKARNSRSNNNNKDSGDEGEDDDDSEVEDCDGDKAPTDSLAFSCFHIKTGSCKHLDIHEPMLLHVCSHPNQSHCTTSSDALVPLMDQSSYSSSYSSPRSFSRNKSTLKLHHGIHLHSITDKVLRKFSKGASKCLAHQYRMRLHVATRRYRLKTMEA